MKKGEVYGFSSRQTFRINKSLVFSVAVLVRELQSGEFNGITYDVGIKSNYLKESRIYNPATAKIKSLEGFFVSLHDDEFSRVVTQFERRRKVDSKLRRIEFTSGEFSYLDLLKRDYGIETLVKGQAGAPVGVSFMYKDEQVKPLKISGDEKTSEDKEQGKIEKQGLKEDKQKLKEKQKEEMRKLEDIQKRERERFQNQVNAIMFVYGASNIRDRNERIERLLQDNILTPIASGNYRVFASSNVDILPKYNGQHLYIISEDVAKEFVKKISRGCRVERNEG